MPRNGSTSAWRKLRAQVIAEEPLCWLRLPGCTLISDTADHVIPVSIRPDLEYERGNCRGACAHCNFSRQDKPIEAAHSSTVLTHFD